MSRAADRYQSKTASPKKVWHIAFYIRLSRKDSRGKDESESITNQRLILADFIAEQDDGDEYVFTGEYVDDGISGTTDEEREGFQRLLTDIQSGKINCVVVKNLARSFRNNGDQSYYLDDWFPRHNVRFISLYMQPVDTYKDPKNAQSIAVPVQGVLNEEHARGTSESVRRTFDAKREKGLHIGSFAPYGYLKDPEDKNALIIDEEAAEHIRSIFIWFLSGMSKNAIVQRLNAAGILCPAAYKKSKGMKYQNPRVDGSTPLWGPVSITNILKNRVYAGDMVQGRYRIKSYKIHVQEKVPAEEWFIVENTHEPIIGRADFEKVQEHLRKDTRTSPTQSRLYLFSGFLRCADCGKAMTRSKSGRNVYYYCRTYKDHSKEACTKHTVRHHELERGVLYALRQSIYAAADMNKIMSCLNAAPPPKSPAIRLDEQIAAKEKELSRIMHYKQSIYQDWKDGNLTHRDYLHMQADYERQINGIHNVAAALREERAGLENRTDTEHPFLTAFRKHGNIGQLTRELLIELIEVINVHDNGSIQIKLRIRTPYQSYHGYNPAGHPLYQCNYPGSPPCNTS